MDLRPELALSLASSILAVGVSYGIIKTREERIMDELRKLKDWKDNQNVLCNDHILTYEREHEKLKGEVKVQGSLNDEKYKEIIRRLDKIEKIVDRRFGESGESS